MNKLIKLKILQLILVIIILKIMIQNIWQIGILNKWLI
jgi:hypothetical protein